MSAKLATISNSSLRHATQSLPHALPASLLAQTFTSLHLRSEFSTSAPAYERHKPHHKPYKKRRDGNSLRGVSELRRTGLRYPVGMSRVPLPQPVLDPKRRTKVTGDPNHGLWGFFSKEKKVFEPSAETRAHGKKQITYHLH